MPEIKRMAEQANRMGQQAQEQAVRVGEELQTAAEGGLEAATRSIGEMNKGLQAVAVEMTEFSKSRLEDVLQSWEQLLRARNFGEIIDVQARYAQRAYDAYLSEISKLGEMYLGTSRYVSKPVEQASKRSLS
jgi:hypothetical protein